MFTSSVQLAWRELRANSFRSLLTTLGIVVGVAGVIIVATLASGIAQQIAADIASLGRNTLIVGPPSGGGRVGSRPPAFRISDAEAIARELPAVSFAAPLHSRTLQTTLGNRSVSVEIVGTTNDYLDLREWHVVQGRQFSNSEQRGGRTICIVGATTRTNLFASQIALGAKLRVGSIACEVIGVLEVKGHSVVGPDQDDVILMPLRTFQRRILGSETVREIWIGVATASLTDQTQQAIRRLLRQRRKLRADKRDNFFITDAREIASIVGSTTGLLTMGLAALAGISLVVGGIGIMNVMLATVTERTREIGIRLAIGARERDVLLQFLIEAVLLSSLGGTLGIAAGLLLAAALTLAIGIPFIFSGSAVTVSLLFAAFIGVAFGYVPARRAARLDPVVALGHE